MSTYSRTGPHISPSNLQHPDVLKIRYGCHARAGEWAAAADVARMLCRNAAERPSAWVHLAYALHQMGQTQKAWEVLLGIGQNFPDEYIISYDLACYACRLSRLNEAWDWIKRAIGLAGQKRIQQMALSDSDLEPLWRELLSNR